MESFTALASEPELPSSSEPSRKRRRLSPKGDEETATTNSDRKRLIKSFVSQPVSPPPLRRTKTASSIPQTPVATEPKAVAEAIKSPFQLTWIQDLPNSSNVDAVSLKDILGDPLISICWNFNYLHDVEFFMDAFDSDVRDQIDVHLVHGFWKREDGLDLKTEAKKYSNLKLHTAYMPEIFGTHHSKMLILFRHDDTAQVIIHTANMIPFDWANMTQALWKSSMLPKMADCLAPSTSNAFGSGSKFKTDLLNYLRAYDGERTICKPLVEELSKYDFSEIRAALVASVPGRQDFDGQHETTWGWPVLRKVLSSIPASKEEAEIIIQISSIATLGSTNKWLEDTFFKSLRTSKTNLASKPKFRIVFPTADEIRRSLNGYRSGSAIHTKTQSKNQQAQLKYLKPLLYHWAGDGAQHSSTSSEPILDAGRKRAAPHIKTYVRFSNPEKQSLDWMLVTSANLSTQAWGAAISKGGDVRICSYEIGVMAWPELYGKNAKMVPTFKTDKPKESEVGGEVVVGARMPYDLPLVQYAKDDLPWVATASYTEPDWQGITYTVQEG